MQFIDEAIVMVKGGNGGDGVVAWRREKYVPKGGPAGGDGGRGGNIVFQAQAGLTTLVEFRFKQQFAATSGDAGGSSNKSGRAGNDLRIAVPAGTVVYERSPDGSERIMADLSEDGSELVVVRGGRGGLGNQNFATSTRQAPTFAEKGEPGEERTVRLELKLLADCGLVGLPNAGKSTLLSVVSAARPKIADYPFTTLEPQLGVVRLDAEASFVMVDLPGLIEGASDGIGLGDRFLRHAERTRMLVHLLDGALELDEILSNKSVIETELRAWNPMLADKPTILVLSKADLPDARERHTELLERFPDLLFISAVTHEGVAELTRRVWTRISVMPPPAVLQPEPRRISLIAREPFEVAVQDGVYVLSGERVERLAAMTNFESDEGLGRFERIIAKLGVDKRLRELGAREGDTVRIGDAEFLFS